MATPDATVPVDREIRAGSMVLSVLENPLNTRILRAHAKCPQRLAELQEKIGWPAEATMRAAVANLREIGALRKEKVGTTPYAVATTLTSAGEEMLCVADEIEAWLALCPDGPIAPDAPEAKSAVKALAGGWNTTMIRALANRPFTLTELNSLIPDISYPSLERRISWMRVTGQIEPVEKEGRGTPYVITDWLRHAIAPLSLAGRCELHHMAGIGCPIGSVEVESSFLMVLPLAPLPEQTSGTVMLAAQTDPDDPEHETGLAGVTVEVKGGMLLSCFPQVDAEPSTWGVGSPEAWLDAVIDGRIDDLRIGGVKPQLALDLVGGLHHALFARS